MDSQSVRSLFMVTVSNLIMLIFIPQVIIYSDVPLMSQSPGALIKDSEALDPN